MITRRGKIHIIFGIVLMTLSVVVYNLAAYSTLFARLQAYDLIKTLLPGLFSESLFSTALAFAIVGAALIIETFVSMLLFTRAAKASLIVQKTVDRDRVFAGNFVTVTVRIINKSRSPIPVAEVYDAIPDSMDLALGDNYAVLAIPPHGSVEFSYVLYAPVRGKYKIGPTDIIIRDRAALFSVKRTVESYVEVLVYPPYEDVAKIELSLRRSKSGFLSGVHQSLAIGTGMDFVGLRKFYPGDDPRFIDRKAYARYNELMVKEFTTERDMRIYLLIDSSFTMGIGEERNTKLDYAIRAAMVLMRIAEKSKDFVGIGAYQERPVFLYKAKAPHRIKMKVLEDLALLQPRGVPNLDNMVRRLFALDRRFDGVFIISDLEGNIHNTIQGIKRLLARRTHVIVIAPFTPYFEPYEDLGELGKYLAESYSYKYRLNRIEAERRIRELGVPVITVGPKDFMKEFVKALVALKRSAALKRLRI